MKKNEGKMKEGKKRRRRKRRQGGNLTGWQKHVKREVYDVIEFW